MPASFRALRVPIFASFAALAACAGATGPQGLSVDLGVGGVVSAACAADGPCVIPRQDGAKLAEGELRGGVTVGPWRFYDAKGQVREEGELVAGERRGEWRLSGVFRSGSGPGYVGLATRAYETSAVSASGGYEGGAMKGTWVLREPELTREYTFSGQVAKNGLGILHGPYVGRVGGQKTLEGQFERGQPVGEWRKWYPTGELRGIYAPPEGEFVELYRSGAKRKSGRLAGDIEVFRVPFAEWAEALPLRRAGPQEAWEYAAKETLDGTPINDLGAPCQAGTTTAGAIDGTTIEQWCQKPERQGVRAKHGPFRSWHYPLGLKLEGEFEDGVRHGTFKKGKPHGEWRYFSSNGQVERVEKR